MATTERSFAPTLALLFAALLLIAAASAWTGYRFLVSDSLDAIETQHRTAVIESATDRIAGTLASTEHLAQLIAVALNVGTRASVAPATAAKPTTALADAQGIERFVQSLISLPRFSPVREIGIWPAVVADRGFVPIAPQRWFIDNNKLLTGAIDVDYASKAWFMIAANSRLGRCLWSASADRPGHASCTMPVGNQRMAVALTISIDLTAVADASNDRDLEIRHVFENAAGNALVFDEQNRLFLGQPRGITNQDPAWRQIIAKLTERASGRARRVIESEQYSAAAVSALIERQPDIDRDAAEKQLLAAWATRIDTSTDDSVMSWTVNYDKGGYRSLEVSAHDIPGTLWTFLWTEGSDPLIPTRYLDRQMLIVMLASLVIGLMLALAMTRAIVLRPLHRMIQRLQSWNDREAPPVLDERAAGEAGVIAGLVNQRSAQLIEQAYANAGSAAIAGRNDNESEFSTDDVALQNAAEESSGSLTGTLHWMRSRHDAMFETDDDAVIILDERGRIDALNTRAEQLTGLSTESDRGRSFGSAVRFESSEDNEAYRPSSRVESGESLNDEPVTVLDVNGEPHARHLHSRPIQVPNENRPAGYLVRLRNPHRSTDREYSESTDVTANSIATDTTDGLGHRDPLTGLRNRLLLEQHVRATTAANHDPQSPPALLFVDVDNVRRVNDIGGHEAGDELLRLIAVTLEQDIGDQNHAFYIGGDKFAVVSDPSSDPEALAESIRVAVQADGFRWADQDFLITVSIGVAFLNQPGELARDVMRRADAACSSAKAAGRNCVRIYDGASQKRDEEDEQKWLRCIRLGLDEDRFHLTTQPIVALQPNASSGGIHEVLIQLEDEDGFWTSPGTFLPVAERHGMIGTIDRWVVTQSLEWLRNNPSDLEKLSVCALNISAQSLVDEKFLVHVVEQLERTGVDPRKLSFEITEDAVSRNATAIRTFVRTLRSMGCCSSLDVFTAGLASARSLREMPVNFVKIDGRLTRSLADEPADRIVVESIHKIASLNGCKTIAEHIDDLALLPILRDIGVDYIQGFAIGRPSPELFQGGESLPNMTGATA